VSRVLPVLPPHTDPLTAEDAKLLFLVLAAAADAGVLGTPVVWRSWYNEPPSTISNGDLLPYWVGLLSHLRYPQAADRERVLRALRSFRPDLRVVQVDSDRGLVLTSRGFERSPRK
jgi:hypothetical protein